MNRQDALRRYGEAIYRSARPSNLALNTLSTPAVSAIYLSAARRRNFCFIALIWERYAATS
jgi:hypothetical protein